MGSGDLSPDLSVGVLVPAASMRRVEGQSPNQDAQGQARRRNRPEEAKRDDDSPTSETAEKTEHQLDHLA